MRTRQRMQRPAIFLTTLLLLSLILVLIAVPACGGSSNSEPSDSLGKALKSMEDNPSFGIRAGWIDSKGEAAFSISDDTKLEFILPDKISYYTKNAYDSYPYIKKIGDNAYTSDDGVHWQEMWGTAWAANTSIENPYQLLKHAINQVDKGTATVDGKLYRVIEANVDMDAWVKENAPAPVLSIYLEDCIFGEGKPDNELLKSLGYEVLQQTESLSRMLRDNVYIEVYCGGGPNAFSAQVKNATELSPELKQEFARIMESFGLTACGLENAEPRIQGYEDYFSYLANDMTSMHLKIYADDKSFLPNRIIAEWQHRLAEGVEKYPAVIDITYDEAITIEKPEKVIHEKKAETLFHLIQDRSGQLQRILNAYKEANGMFPETLDLETVSDVMNALALEWPTNPITGALMVEKLDSPGDYHYESVDDGQYCKLVIYDYFAAPIPCYGPAEQGMPSARPDHPVSHELTSEQKDLALKILFNDLRVQELLEGKGYDVGNVVPVFQESEMLMGASVEIGLKDHCIIEYDWPFVEYNENGSFTESTRHWALWVESMEVRVDFTAGKVIEITPYSMDD